MIWQKAHKMTRLDIISDPICPWCYIGKANLDKALAAHPDHPFEITWRPFQLNPDMPREGMDRREYLETKFGKEGAVKAYAVVEEHAAAAGLTINYDKIQRTPNTLDAHRLIRWAAVDGKQNAVVTDLFQRNFVLGEDISDHAVLVDVAVKAGMDGDAIARLLEGDADLAEVQAEDRQAREMGVQGVPCFIVAGAHALSGAHPTELWEQVIAEIKAAAANN